MQSIILKKHNLDIYRPEKFVDSQLYSLAFFLITDGTMSIDDNDQPETDFWVEWAQEPERQWTGGDCMEMIKKDNRVYVMFQFRENRDDLSKSFSTSVENFIEILKKWHDIFAMKPFPDEIILTESGDWVTLTPKFYWKEDAILGAVALKS